MAQYGCARATVSKAVQSLAGEGLIERRRRAGSFVARPPLQSAVLEIPELQAVVTGRGQIYRHEIVSRRTRRPDPAAPGEAALHGAGRVLALVCRHFADDRPFALEERLISLDVAPEAAAEDFSRIAPGAWLLDHVVWSEAEHRISATAADEETSTRLDLPSGAPCLMLRRWTWRGDEAVTYVRQIFPAEAFELTARFAPKSFR